MRFIMPIVVAILVFANIMQTNIDNQNVKKHLQYRVEVSEIIYKEIEDEMNEMYTSPLTKVIRPVKVTSNEKGYDLTIEPKFTTKYAESYLDPYGSDYTIKTYEPNRTFNELPNSLNPSLTFDTSTGKILKDCYAYKFKYVPTKYSYAPRQSISMNKMKAGDVLDMSSNFITFLTDGHTYSIGVPPNSITSNSSMGDYTSPLVSVTTSKKIEATQQSYTTKLTVYNIKDIELKFIKTNRNPTVNGRPVSTIYTNEYAKSKDSKLLTTTELTIVSDFPPAIKIKHELLDNVEWSVSNINYALKSLRYTV